MGNANQGKDYLKIERMNSYEVGFVGSLSEEEIDAFVRSHPIRLINDVIFSSGNSIFF